MDSTYRGQPPQDRRRRRRLPRGRTRPPISARNTAFVCLFAAQAGLLTLSPILPRVAREFGVSTAAAGQLRTLAGLVGGVAAVAVVLVGRRIGLRRILLAGSGLLVLGSVASAAAPSLTALALPDPAAISHTSSAVLIVGRVSVSRTGGGLGLPRTAVQGRLS